MTRPFPANVVIGNGARFRLCALEWVAYLAGEPPGYAFSEGACPVVSAYLRRLNDRMPDDATRTKALRPILERVVGSKRDRDVEIRRVYRLVHNAAADHLVRAFDALDVPPPRCLAIDCPVDPESAQAVLSAVRRVRPVLPELAPIVSHAYLAAEAALDGAKPIAALYAADVAADAAIITRSWDAAVSSAWDALNVD